MINRTEQQRRKDRNEIKAEMDAAFPPAFRMSKSGKKMTVQYGATWYEEHDVTLYTPLKVLTDLIPEGAEGHVRHRNALRLLQRLMKHPGFGTTAQIELLLSVNNGAYKEVITFLLTKKQYLWMASALSDEYLALAINHQYASLSESDRALESTHFVEMIRSQTVSAWNDATRARTAEQVEATMTAMEQLDKAIAENNFPEEGTPDYAAALAEVESFIALLNSSTADIPLEDMWKDDIFPHALELAISLRDTINVFLVEQVGPVEKAVEMTEKLRRDFSLANCTIRFLSGLNHAFTNDDFKEKYRLWDTSEITTSTYIWNMSGGYNSRIATRLEREGISVTDTGRKNACRLDVIEFGLYMTVYDIMSRTDMQTKLEADYIKKYGYTAKQVARIAQVISCYVNLPKFKSGLVVISAPHRDTWEIFTAHR